MANTQVKKALMGLFMIGILHVSAAAAELRRVDFDFYGHEVALEYDLKINTIRSSGNMSQFIKTFDETCQSTDYVTAINSIRKLTTLYEMDDIGKLLLINAFAEKAFANRNKQFKTLIKWYLLRHDSMDVMLCYSENDITLYGRLNVTPYGIAYLTKNNKTYTELSFNTIQPEFTSVSEYRSKEKIIGGNRVFKLNKGQYPKIDALKTIKEFSFVHADKTYTYTAEINQSLVNYLKDLPVVELGNFYVNYGFSETIKNTLLADLKTTIKPMKLREALSFLLKFVQNLPYKADGDYLGYERYSFSEETLCNEFADCEDKVILYASLIRELLNIKSIALMYENDEHVAIGLQLKGELNDFSFSYKNQLFIAAEPSGTGFELGKVGFDLKLVTKAVELY